MVEIAARHASGKSVVLFGHSMGSAIGQAYVAQGGAGLKAYAWSNRSG
jgi:alpha-beta hydrolase superfamily lysophospholipase